MPSPAAPTTGLTAELYTLKEISLLSTVYTQQPPCAYTLSSSFAWIIPSGAPIQVNANPQIITVYSAAKNKVGTYTVRLTNTFTNSSFQGNPQTFAPYQEFIVTVIDPCDTTVITTPAFTPSTTITVINGQTAFSTFQEAVDSVETAINLGNICGPRAYSILETGTVVTWGVTVAADPTSAGCYKITASPTADNTVGTHNLHLRIVLTSQPNHAVVDVAFTVVVQTATCDCSLIQWQHPGSQNTKTVDLTVTPSTDTLVISPSTIIASSKTATPAIRICATTTPCDETFTLTPVKKGTSSLPKFVTFNSGTNTLTIAPVDYLDIGTWTLSVTQTVASGTVPIWDQIVINVGCMITSITNPANPLVSLTTYDVYSSTKTIDLSSAVYLQVPNCNYAVTKSYAWTGIVTPITSHPTNPQAIQV